MTKARRTDLQISYDILNAVLTRIEKSNYSGRNITTGLTSLQLSTGLNYDKIKERVFRLEKAGLLDTDPLTITNRGVLFLREFEIIQKQNTRLEDYIHNLLTDQEKTRLPVGLEHQIKETQQLINVQDAIIEEYEKIHRDNS